MIRNTKQNWTKGETVKIGFMSLVVMLAIPTPGDGAPDAYILTNQAGNQLYKFVPHNGCQRISHDEALELIEGAKVRAAAIAARATAQAAAASKVGKFINEWMTA